MIKFSIIIPIYNVSKYLDKCLDSCINQTYANIEIICIDDCSTDNSRDIIQSFQNRDKRVKSFFHKKNESQYMARRTGIENATGDYILFLDGDDTFRYDACALLSKKIEETNSDIIQFGWRNVSTGKEYFSPFYTTSKETIAAYLAKENRSSQAVWIKAYRRDVILKAYNCMDEFYASGAEDIYTSIVIAFCASSFSFLKQPLVNYTDTVGWTSRREYSLQVYITWLTSYKIIIEKITAFIKQNIPEFVVKCPDMEFHLLNDFISCRLPGDVSQDLKYHFFDVLPNFFSKETLYALIDELFYKSSVYERYLDIKGSFIIKIKKLIKYFLKLFFDYCDEYEKNRSS